MLSLYREGTPPALKRHARWFYLSYAVGVVAIFAGVLGGRYFDAPLVVVLSCFGGVATWFSGLLAAVLLRQRDINRVRDLHGRVCTACLYDLSTLGPAGTCPECGTPYTAAGTVRRWRDADRSYRAKTLYTLDE